MRLTNTLRQAFVRAAMQDVPTIDYEAAIRKRAVELVYAALPKAAQQLWDDPKNQRLLKCTSRSFGGVSVYLPTYPGGADVGFDDNLYLRAEHIADPQLKRLVTDNKAQESQMKALKAKLEGAVAGYSTAKQLREAMPEFAKYLPEEATRTSNLPALANVLTDFVEAGWPKGKKPTAEEVAA